MMFDDEEVLVRIELEERRKELERAAAAQALRDQFAMAALTGMLAGRDGGYDYGRDAGHAYRHADAMVAARGGK